MNEQGGAGAPRNRWGFSGVPKTEASKLGDLLKWVGGGFALLTGIATFFGIQQGVVARIVRIHPYPVLWVFILVGVAVVLALTVPAITSNTSVPWWLVVLLGGAVVVASVFLSPDLRGRQPDTPWTWLVIVAIGVTAAVLAFVKNPSPTLSWSVALVIIAVTCLSCGLYIVTKLSVLEKMRLESAAVISSVSMSGGQSMVDISAAGTELAGPVRVRVVGQSTGEDEETVLGEQVLMPSRAGTLEAKVSIPIPGTLATVRVLSCPEWDTTQRKACDPTTQQALFELAPPQSGLSASLSTSEDGKQVLLELSGSGFQPGSYLNVSAGPRGQEPQVTARVRAGTDGAITWKGQALVASSVVWHLSASECRPMGGSPDRCSAQEELATLSVSAP